MPILYEVKKDSVNNGYMVFDGSCKCVHVLEQKWTISSVPKPSFVPNIIWSMF